MSLRIERLLEKQAQQIEELQSKHNKLEDTLFTLMSGSFTAKLASAIQEGIDNYEISELLK
jgi:hypothetical protein